MRSKRYGGKGCLNAVDNVTRVIAPQFLGQKIASLGTLADIDRELLMLELDLAMKRGKISADASVEERILIMQRKANLGMNAVLSMSLALGRLIAARDGQELPDVLRKIELMYVLPRLFRLWLKAQGRSCALSFSPLAKSAICHPAVGVEDSPPCRFSRADGWTSML
jgi:hypothetical protein